MGRFDNYHPVRSGTSERPEKLTQEACPMLKTGDKAPDFEVLDHEGNTVRLSNYEGKTVVLWFYPRASTGG
tara:strand:+ start:342 stop:554 length:213 start_codon:yes stop_codon:yes gene_type:complete